MNPSYWQTPLVQTPLVKVPRSKHMSPAPTQTNEPPPAPMLQQPEGQGIPTSASQPKPPPSKVPPPPPVPPVMQIPKLLQDSPALVLQAMQAWPARPQAFDEVPALQLPLVSQQPEQGEPPVVHG